MEAPPWPPAPEAKPDTPSSRPHSIPLPLRRVCSSMSHQFSYVFLGFISPFLRHFRLGLSFALRFLPAIIV